MKYMLFAIACTVLAISGCASPKAQEAANEARCTSYGVPRGSAGFADCMINLAQLDALEGQLQAQRIGAAGAALSAAGASLRGPQSPTVTCTSVQQGIFTNTTCN